MDFERDDGHDLAHSLSYGKNGLNKDEKVVNMGKICERPPRLRNSNVAGIYLPRRKKMSEIKIRLN